MRIFWSVLAITTPSWSSSRQRRCTRSADFRSPGPSTWAGRDPPDWPTHPNVGLLAVATRSGSIHMIQIDWRVNSSERPPEGVAASPDGFTRR